MKISIDIAGCVNNVHVNVKGRGSLDPEASALDLELEADRNTVHWDLALLPVCCFDPFLAMAGCAVEVPEEGIPPVAFRSWADIFDDNDREMGRIVVAGQVDQLGGAVEVEGQILECNARFEIGEQVISVAAATRLAAFRSPGGRFELSRTASFETLRGQSYRTINAGWMQGAEAAGTCRGHLRDLEVSSVEIERPRRCGIMIAVRAGESGSCHPMRR